MFFPLCSWDWTVTFDPCSSPWAVSPAISSLILRTFSDFWKKFRYFSVLKIFSTCFKFYTAPVSARLTHPFTPWSHFFPFKPLSIFIIAVLGVLSANPKMLLISRSVSMGAILPSVHNTLLFLCTLLSQLLLSTEYLVFSTCICTSLVS